MNETSMDPGRDDDRFVERLIALAERGPAVPPDGAARMKEAIRPVWRDEVRRRATRRRMAWSALAAAAALAIVVPIAWRVSARPAQPVGHVALLRGDLRIEARDGRARPALPGDVLREGDRLRTGPGGRASIALGSSLAVRLDTATAALLESERTLALDAGAVYLDSGGAVHAEVRTPMSVVRDVGTRFEVRHEDGGTRVRVRDGSVFVVAHGEPLRVDRGRELTVSASGSRAGTIEPSASAWEWVLDVSTPFHIEGKSVAAFLGWVEAETGLRIEYADAASERVAREAVLHGDLGELRADQAPAVVLPSAGLEAAIEDGVLRVGRAGTTD